MVDRFSGIFFNIIKQSLTKRLESIMIHSNYFRYDWRNMAELK